MSELTPEQRIAALKARGGSGKAPKEKSHEKETPTTRSEPTAPAASSAGRPVPTTAVSSARPNLTRPSTIRVATAGASIVSFAAMVVAMGPLTISSQEVAASEDGDTDSSPVIPEPPRDVVIEVIPNYVPADAPLLALTDEAADQDRETPAAAGVPSGASPATASTEPVTARPATAAAQPAVAAVPTSAPPAAQPPATVAPVTAPPTTAAPATQPPTTATPTTAAPATQPPPPPKSDKSG